MSRIAPRAPLSQADIDEANSWSTAGCLPRASTRGYDLETRVPESVVAGRTKLAAAILAASLLAFGGAAVTGYLASRGMLPWQ